MTASRTERDAMTRALALAADSGVLPYPNPYVGCVILDRDGTPVGEGRHRGAGTPHAEVEALAAAGDRAAGGTAVVTLEPCDHTGRTGPCSVALIEAGVARVVYAQADPNPEASGGAERLRAAGVAVEGGLLADEAAALNHAWTFSVTHGRPFVTWKLAVGLDGRSAAADGTSRWISSAAARADAHLLRARCDVMLVGTNTVAIDDPRLTVRDPDGSTRAQQPLRAVMGERDLDPAAAILDPDVGSSRQLRTRDPQAALAELAELECRHVLLEGGPTLAAAFLRAGLVDEIVCYVAPMLLGSGPAAVGDLGIDTIADALRPEVRDITVLPPAAAGDRPNVRLTLTPGPVPRQED